MRNWIYHRALSAIPCFLAVAEIPATAFAAASDRVSFNIKPKVVTKLISAKPGERRYRVLSNAPFLISASGLIGPVKAGISDVGGNAQLPGPKRMCRRATGLLSSIVYRSKRRTAAKPGRPMSQSVIVTLKYDKDLAPKFKIKPRKGSNRPLGKRCIAVDSPPLDP